MDVTIHYIDADGTVVPVATILPCSPHVGMRVEFFDGNAGIELAGIVCQVVARDLDGDIDLHVYTTRA